MKRVVLKSYQTAGSTKQIVHESGELRVQQTGGGARMVCQWTRDISWDHRNQGVWDGWSEKSKRERLDDKKAIKVQRKRNSRAQGEERVESTPFFSLSPRESDNKCPIETKEEDKRKNEKSLGANAQRSTQIRGSSYNRIFNESRWIKWDRQR